MVPVVGIVLDDEPFVAEDNDGGRHSYRVMKVFRTPAKK